MPHNIYVAMAWSNGNVAPLATITGPSTVLSTPYGVAVDASRNIYVTNANASLNIYAAGADSNVAPITVISGQTRSSVAVSRHYALRGGKGTDNRFLWRKIQH
jgi:hypothetical protein